MMGYKLANNLLYGTKYLKIKQRGAYCSKKVFLYNSAEEPHEEIFHSEWYEQAFTKATKLARLLENVDSIDGRLININDNSTITDEHIEQKMHTFKSLARTFLGSPSVQQQLKTNVTKNTTFMQDVAYFSKPNEREPMTINSLTKVSSFLNISAQQKKLVRLTVCSQVTEHRIWTSTLEEILNELKIDFESLSYHCADKGTEMGIQIVSSCLKLLAKTASLDDPESTSWMRLLPTKEADSYTIHKWEDVLEMFNDLIKCLRSKKRLNCYLLKVEAMKEGLNQIRDVIMDKNIGYREAKHQESLIRKKLSKNLGHSSKGLFTLLIYYLYGSIRDIEVEICGGVYGVGGDRFCLCMGKIMSSNEEEMVLSGVKQLDRALGLFKFVWETAGMRGNLELQGHLWYFGTKQRTLTYKGNSYFVHGIDL